MNHEPKTILRVAGVPVACGEGARPARRRGGFSLAEILVATAVLGVGLVMVIAVFPAAIEVNKDSTADVMGTMICQNALNIAKTKLQRSQVAVSVFTQGVSLPSLTDADLSYPSGDANLYRGSLVLARRVSNPNDRNDYQFVLAAFTKAKQANVVRAHALTLVGTLDANAMAFSVPSTERIWLKIGSPVIDPAKGAYANIAGFVSAGANSTVYLNHPLDRGPIGRLVSSPLVIVETDSTGTTPDAGIAATPVTCIMIARSGLKQ